MSWLALFTATALLAVLPLLPALAECRRGHRAPSPPPDDGDASDPAHTARRFRARLALALADGAREISAGREIVGLPAPWAWPLDEDELRQQRTQRVWHAAGDLMLPRGMHFEAEVLAEGHLHTAPHGRHHALWAGRRLALAERSGVDAWAHGQEVEAAAGCRLRGAVTAERRIVLQRDVGFTVLHAPELRTEPAAPARPAPPQPVPLPEALAWDGRTGRALFREPLHIGPGHEWPGDIVSHGDITLGAGCAAHGSLKAHGELRLGEDVVVDGSLVAEGRIELGAGCRVAGPVVSAATVVLGSGCQVGAPGRPTTVSAPRIELAPGVVVHGALHATIDGRTQ